MKNDIKTRILKLAEMVGIGTAEGSTELAELEGYTEGLTLILSDLEKLTCSLSPVEATGYAFGLLCDLFGITYSLSDDEKRQLILKGFALRNIDYTDGEFEQKMADAQFSATLSAGKMTLACEAAPTKERFSALAKILKNYAAPNLYITFNGDGITCGEWDRLGFMFYEFDRLKFPFSMLDTMKTEDL